MIPLKLITMLAEALPRCSIVLSASSLLIVDRNGEIMGDLKKNAVCVTIYKNYTYSMKVIRRLKRTSIPVEVLNIPKMEHAANILYNPPTQIL